MRDNRTVFTLHFFQGKDTGNGCQFFTAETTHNTRFAEQGFHCRVRVGNRTCVGRCGTLTDIRTTRFYGCDMTTLANQGRSMIQELIRIFDLLDIEHLYFGVKDRVEVAIHIFDHFFHSNLLGVTDRPNRRKTESFCQSRFNNEKCRTTRTGNKIDPVCMKFGNRLSKNTMIMHIHQTDAIRTDQ